MAVSFALVSQIESEILLPGGLFHVSAEDHVILLSLQENNCLAVLGLRAANATRHSFSVPVRHRVAVIPAASPEPWLLLGAAAAMS